MGDTVVGDVFLTPQWAPAPVNILGTVIATLLVTAVVIWAVSWWRARKLGY
jgi:hypothetical protein